MSTSILKPEFHHVVIDVFPSSNDVSAELTKQYIYSMFWSEERSRV